MTPRALETLRALRAADAQFVVIGGLAGALRGSPTPTTDVDFCPDQAPGNIERVIAGLAALHAVERDTKEPPPLAGLRADGAFLRCETDHGPVDVLVRPRGTLGYPDLAPGADRIDLDGVIVDVAALDDLIWMRRASARQKDLAELEVLLALREEITESA